MRRKVYSVLIVLSLAGCWILFGPLYWPAKDYGSANRNQAPAKDYGSANRNQAPTVPRAHDLSEGLNLRRAGRADQPVELKAPINFLETDPQESGLYYKEKQSFYETLNLTQDQFRRKRKTAHPDNPLFKFYIDRLKNDNQATSGETVRLFVSSLSPRDDWELEESIAQDATEIGAVFYGLSTLAPYVSTRSFIYPELYELIVALIPHLEGENDQRRADALKIMNAASFGAYEDRTPKWWSSEFTSSPLAEIYLGSHPSQGDQPGARTVLSVVSEGVEVENVDSPK